MEGLLIIMGEVSWSRPEIQIPRRLRQEDGKFKAIWVTECNDILFVF